MKYKAIYKCPLCGEVFESEEETERNVAEDVIVEITERYEIKSLLGNQCFIRRCMAHNCKDDSFGLAYFQGFKKMNED